MTSEEQAVAKRLTGGFGWPTVLLAATLLSVELGVVALWALGIMPTPTSRSKDRCGRCR